MSRGIIFQKLCTIGGDTIQFIPFNHAFYALKSPLFYNHHNCGDDVTIIPSTMRTCQGDPLGRALFVLTHFKALHSTSSHFLFYLFPSIVNNIHIISSSSIVSFAYEHFQTKFCAIGQSI
jgi:hypothetical protein